MSANHQEDLREYRTYFGLTMLQFLVALMFLGVATAAVMKFFF